MAHNTILSAPVGVGDTVVDVDLSLNTYPTTGKLPASCLYVSANNTTAPTPVTATNGLYVQPGTSSLWSVGDTAVTAGGTSVYSFLSTAAVQAAAIKGSVGQVYALHFFNINATPVYVRLYNQVASPVTTDTPVYRAIVPGNTAGAGYVVALPPGVAFSLGIGIRVTAAIADNDATVLAANTVAGNVFYK